MAEAAPGDHARQGGDGASALVRNALPLLLFLCIGFAAPLLAVIAYSFMPPRSFGLIHAPTLANYAEIFTSNSYISFFWSLLFAALTVILLALICYPIAYGLARVFGRWAPVLTLLFTIPLFVSENVRLYGWILFFIKNGVLLGTLKSLFGIELDSWLFTRAHHPARHGLCLSALHAVSDDARRRDGAARDRATPPSISAPRAGRSSARSSCRCRCRASSSACC